MFSFLSTKKDESEDFEIIPQGDSHDDEKVEKIEQEPLIENVVESEKVVEKVESDNVVEKVEKVESEENDEPEVERRIMISLGVILGSEREERVKKMLMKDIIELTVYGGLDLPTNVKLMNLQELSDHHKEIYNKLST